MKRDFTSDNLSRIDQYIDEMNDEKSIWDNIIQFFVMGLIPTIVSFFENLFSSILSLLIRNDDDPSGEEVKWYYQYVINKNEELRYLIGWIFKIANEADVEYAARGERLLTSGNEILKELKYLIEVATPEGISNIANSKAPEIIISSILDDESAVSDEDLIAFCNGDVSVVYSSYLKAICEANNAVLDIDGMDIFLVLLFKHSDIAVDTIIGYLNSSGGTNARKWITEQILNGSEGFATVQEIAERLGYDVETIERYLQYGTLTESVGYGELTRNYAHNFENEVALKNGIDSIIAEHVQMVFENDELLEKYCNDMGINIEYFNAIRSDSYNAYEKSLFYENLGDVFSEACSSAEYQKNFDMNLSDVTKMIGVITKGQGIWESTTDEGKLWDEIVKKDGSIDEGKAAQFLLEYCGLEEVGSDELNLFGNLVENINGLGGASKIMSESQEWLNALAYWTTDYTQEVEMIDSLMQSAEGNSSYYAALYELRETYTNKCQATLEGAVVSIEEKLIKGALKKVPGLEVVENVISLTGTLSGASGYTDAVMDLMTYPEMSNQMLAAYNDSVASVAAGDTTATESVRLNFIALKQTLSNYYDASCNYYEGMAGDAGADPQRLAYSRYMSDKVDDMEIGETFEFLSFEEFIDTYSI